jgi:hypothetical protein
MEAVLAAAGASLVLWAAAFLYFRAYLKRRTGSERILGEFREEVSKLVAEIDAATDRDATLVEERVKALRGVVAEADRRLAALTRELERRSGAEQAYADLGRRAPRPRNETASPEPLQNRRPPPAPYAGGSEAALGPAAAAAVAPPPAFRAPPAFQAPPAAEPAAPPGAGAMIEPAPDPSRNGTAEAPRVYRSTTPIEPRGVPFAERAAELFRAGFSADLIATRLGATVAEVDLAVALALRPEEKHADDARD